MERISSRQNPIVKQFRAAANGDAEGLMLLDGDHLVREALASGIQLEVAALVEGFPDRELAAQVERTARQVIVVTGQVLAAISPVRTPSGIVAMARRPEVPLESAFMKPPQLVVVLHDLQDPGNVGAIVRAAEGCGVTGLVCNERTADPFGWKALRGGMGSTLRLPVAKGTTADVMRRARDSGLRIFATVARGGTPLRQCDLRAPVALVLGGEGAGLPGAVVEAADGQITIPMNPPVESLNVAIAAALLVYEASRQRGTPSVQESFHVPL
jgi:RNA methyltransferase, TrmH family